MQEKQQVFKKQNLAKFQNSLNFLIAFAVFFVFLFGFVFFSGKLFFTVVSDSMKPTLFRGDIVVVEPSSQIIAGNIIVFRQENQTIIHRVFRQQNVFFLTKADASPFVDSFMVKKDQVVGKVVFVIPVLGHLGIFFAGK